MKRLLLLFFLLAPGCLSTVSIRPNYDLQKIHTAALLSLDDFPGAPGSGRIVTALLEKSFLAWDFRLVERRQVDEILKEQALQSAGALDLATVRKLGKILGADALMLGSVTTFTPERESVSYMQVREQREEPIFEQRTERIKIGEEYKWVTRTVQTGYNTTESLTTMPQYYRADAAVGVSLRMVEVETGEVIWVATTMEEGYNTQVAAGILAERIGRSVEKLIAKNKKEQQKLRSQRTSSPALVQSLPID